MAKVIQGKRAQCRERSRKIAQRKGEGKVTKLGSGIPLSLMLGVHIPRLRRGSYIPWLVSGLVIGRRLIRAKVALRSVISAAMSDRRFPLSGLVCKGSGIRIRQVCRGFRIRGHVPRSTRALPLTDPTKPEMLLVERDHGNEEEFKPGCTLSSKNSS